MTPDRRPIRERLADYYTEPEIRLMIRTAQDAFDGQTLGEMILTGRAAEVHELIDRLHDGLRAGQSNTEGTPDGPQAANP